MSQLTFSTLAAFTDLPDSSIAANQPLTDLSIQAISHNAKYAAVRCEMIPIGFFKHGDVIPVPVSPVDGYTYARDELSFLWMPYTTRAPAAGMISGQLNPPAQASSQAANLYYMLWDISDATGQVSLTTSYWDGSHETVTHDGIVKVMACCQRNSVSVPN